VIGNDGGGGEEMVRSSGGRSFQRPYLEVSRLCSMRWSGVLGCVLNFVKWLWFVKYG